MEQITPIRTEADYQAALSHIDHLFDAEPGSPDADTLEVLTILVERYEVQHYPIAKPDPVAAIKFRMEQDGLTQRDLIPLIGGKAKVSSVLSGRTSLSLKMIRALHTGLGIPAEILIGESPGRLEDRSANPAEYPLKEVQKLGWLPASYSIKEQGEEALQAFFDQTRQFIAPELVFARKNDNQRKNAKMDIRAFELWVLKAATIAGVHPCPPVSRTKIDSAFINKLLSCSLFPDGPSQARHLLTGVGIHVVRLPRLAHTYLDGAAFMLKDGSAVIAMTGRYDRLDNFWFTLFHELKHVTSHLGDSGVFADDLSLRDLPDLVVDEREREADDFACQCLKFAEIDEGLGESPTAFKVIQVAQALGLNPAIVAGRYRFTHKNYRVLASLVGNGEISRCLSESLHL